MALVFISNQMSLTPSAGWWLHRDLGTEGDGGQGREHLHQVFPPEGGR